MHNRLFQTNRFPRYFSVRSFSLETFRMLISRNPKSVNISKIVAIESAVVNMPYSSLPRILPKNDSSMKRKNVVNVEIPEKSRFLTMLYSLFFNLDTPFYFLSQFINRTSPGEFLFQHIKVTVIHGLILFQ